MQVNWQSTQITPGQCWRLDVEIVSRQIASKLIGFMAAKPQIGRFEELNYPPCSLSRLILYGIFKPKFNKLSPAQVNGKYAL